MAAIITNMLFIPRKPAGNSTALGKDSKRYCSAISSAAAAAASTDLLVTSPRCCSFQQNVQTQRRSGNYGPSFWDFNDFQSFYSEYKDERYLRRASELRVEVKKILMLSGKEMESSVEELELIDELQRLGISYHFEDEINQILGGVYHEQKKKYGKNISQGIKERDLYSTALEFRLLRQHGFNVPQEVFNCFKNEKGDFNPSLGNDTRGLLQLYEASFVSTPGEKTIDLARGFATNFLQKNPNKKINENLSLLVRHTLELPIHWRLRRPNARWFIEAYERRSDVNSLVLELAKLDLNIVQRPNAKRFIETYERRSYVNSIVLELVKLDFNIVQAIHQEEFKHLSRWWKQTCIADKLPFARDRLMEAYTWSSGYLPRPEHGYSRIIATKINALTTVLHDIFDVYGTLEELQLFTDAIQRWDTEAIEKLPEYMQIYYLAVYNVVNEMAYDVLTQQGFLAIPHLRKSWADVCTTHLQEAKWYSRGYTPTLEEYINNAYISLTVPLMLSHAYFLVTNPIDVEAVRALSTYHDIIRYSGTIARLADDLATSTDEMKRGDVAKSVECYMNENGASREEAVEYVRFLIDETWKKMNEEALASDSPFSKDFVRMAANVGRIAQYMYQHGDGHGVQGSHIKDRTSSLIFQPIL